MTGAAENPLPSRACYLGHDEGRQGTTCSVCHKVSRERSKQRKRLGAADGTAERKRLQTDETWSAEILALGEERWSASPWRKVEIDARLALIESMRRCARRAAQDPASQSP